MMRAIYGGQKNIATLHADFNSVEPDATLFASRRRASLIMGRPIVPGDLVQVTDGDEFCYATVEGENANGFIVRIDPNSFDEYPRFEVTEQPLMMQQESIPRIIIREPALV